jgi:hypothetical protein
MFQPIKAPEKHRASKIPVLLTAPSRVILSLNGISSIALSNPLLNAGLVDLPNLLIAECLDIIISPMNGILLNLRYLYQI